MALYNRGLPSQGFEYIHYNGGIEPEAVYPYVPKVYQKIGCVMMVLLIIAAYVISETEW